MFAGLAERVLEKWRVENAAFIRDFAEVVKTEPSRLTSEFTLNEEHWDSLAVLSTIALIDDHFGKVVDGEALLRVRSFGELMQLAQS